MVSPAVSVLVCARNVARYLGEALDSVLAQSWQDYEVVIVLDTSTDGTEAVARQYCGRDARFRTIPGTDKGLTLTRRTGILAARAPWIAILDGDDRWLPDKLRLQMEFLRDNPGVIITSGWGRYMGAGGGVRGTYTLGPASAEAWQRMRERMEPVCLLNSTVVFRRDIALQIDPGEPETDVIDDTLMYTRMAEFGSVRTLPIPLIYYRVLPNSTSGSNIARQRMLFRWLAASQRAKLLGERPESPSEFETKERSLGIWWRLGRWREDSCARSYREAGALLADGRWIGGGAKLARAAVLWPRYVARKLRMQIWRPWRSRKQGGI